jgi:hypothetical protein
MIFPRTLGWAAAEMRLRHAPAEVKASSPSPIARLERLIPYLKGSPVRASRQARPHASAPKKTAEPYSLPSMRRVSQSAWKLTTSAGFQNLTLAEKVPRVASSR